MCGIIGLVSRNEVNQTIYDALTVLQHRGQDAAGIMTCDRGRFFLRKANGLVRDVFEARHMMRLRGSMGIGHVRYPTAGSSSTSEAQPFYVNSPYGIALAHNGNLTNTEEIMRDLYREDLRHINTDSDSEVLLNVFAHEMAATGKVVFDPDYAFAAVAGVHRRCKGAYAVVAMISGQGIVGFRDLHGIRPLIYGKRETDNGVEYMFASESVALAVSGFTTIRDVGPGEAVFISMEGEVVTRQVTPRASYHPCIFEYVYFARPDSIIDRISVYKSRLRMGEYLADKIKREFSHHPIDVVIPIPDTSRTSALQLANDLGVRYREGFIKNRYIGRTFIMPGQKQRKKSVRQKLNAIELEFRKKNVLLVDDSIVRGTTSSQIIQMARECGANKVFFASASPPVRFPNVYGIDMPTKNELIGHGRDENEIAKSIGADGLIYQDIDDLINSVKHKSNNDLDGFDASCFNGVYVTGDITPEYLQRLEKQRNDGTKESRKSDNDGIDLYNAS